MTPLNAQVDTLQLGNLIASRKEVVAYLASKNRFFSEDEVMEQPTPLGLAIIANYYEKKNDRITSIYVASCIKDFQTIITKIGLGKNGEKAILIFQPTDNNGEWKDWFFTLHKAVVYVEKKDSILHLAIADSTPFENIKKFCMLLAEQALSDIPRIYYTQEILWVSGMETPICLQTDNWNCGTHAFRIAREIAKDSNFLGNIEIITSSNLSVANFSVQNLVYRIPTGFAKCADADISQKRCKSYYGGPTLIALQSHFERYPEKHSYIKKFTHKYINILKKEFLNSSQEELIASIANVNAKNYPIERANYSPLYRLNV